MINIDQNSRSETATFSFQIVDRIRRQSSWDSCEFCSHHRRRRDATRLDSWAALASAVCFALKIISCTAWSRSLVASQASPNRQNPPNKWLFITLCAFYNITIIAKVCAECRQEFSGSSTSSSQLRLCCYRAMLRRARLCHGTLSVRVQPECTTLNDLWPRFRVIDSLNAAKMTKYKFPNFSANDLSSVPLPLVGPKIINVRYW